MPYWYSLDLLTLVSRDFLLQDVLFHSIAIQAEASRLCSFAGHLHVGSLSLKGLLSIFFVFWAINLKAMFERLSPELGRL